MAGRPTHIVRSRTIMYTVLLLVLSLGLIYAISQRTPLQLDVIRDRNNLYRETPQGLVENVYTLKIINMDERAHQYRVTVSAEESGLDDLQLVMRTPLVEVPPGEVLSLPVSVQVDPVQLKRAANQIVFILTAEDDPTLTGSRNARFLGPVMSR